MKILVFLLGFGLCFLCFAGETTEVARSMKKDQGIALPEHAIGIRFVGEVERSAKTGERQYGFIINDGKGSIWEVRVPSEGSCTLTGKGDQRNILMKIVKISNDEADVVIIEWDNNE